MNHKFLIIFHMTFSQFFSHLWMQTLKSHEEEETGGLVGHGFSVTLYNNVLLVNVS